ncbi:MAG: conjugal transfer protein TraF, partial [Elusimicrobiales bacterium]
IEFTAKTMENAHNLGNVAKDYAAIQSKQTAGGAMNAQQLSAFVQSLPLIADMNRKGTGALVEANGGLNLKFAKVAVSVNNYTAIGASPFVDTTNIGLGTITGTPGSGVNFGTGVVPGPANATQTAAATTIAGAINTINYGTLESLICGGAGCLALQTGNNITNATTLANALVNQAATTGGLSDQQILDAANQLSANAAAAAPIIAAGASGNPYTNNQTDLTIKGGSFTEIAFGLARPLPVNGLTAGGNVKLINGRMAYAKFKVLENESEISDPLKNLADTMKTTWAPAIDLGLMYDLNKLSPKLPMKPRAGIVVRNVNRPSFKNPEAQGGSSHLDTQARMGLAISPAGFWTVALDMDLTKNTTPVNGYDSRQLALGTELNLVNRRAFNIPLRAGVMKNLANSDSKMAYTLGTGINMLYMHFDLAGVVSSNRVTIEDKKYPTKLELAASFGLLF